MPDEIVANRIDMSQQAANWTRPTPLDGFMGPGKPTLPARPEEAPRIFQYRPGQNLVSIPRSGFGMVDFVTLRNLAATCKEVRLNVELIKRQVRGLHWEIVPVRERDKLADSYADEIDAIQEFLEEPDGYHDFDAWINQMMEELLVTDAVTLWPEMMLNGELESLEVIDGTTIRPLLDLRGRIPRPPIPAYVQMIHGVPLSYYERDRLLYEPLNASVASPYGTSPIEWMILAINLSLRREVNQVAEFTEGNVPEALVGAPASWNQSQVDNWQKYWDAMAAGNIKQLRRMHWIPMEGAASNIPVYQFRKDDITNTERDKWLMQVACWAFGNSPAEFGLAPGEGLGGKGYGQAMEGIQYRSMLWPVAEYIASLLTKVIQKRLGKNHLRFAWIGLEPVPDRLKQAQVDQLYINSGVYSVGHVQDRLNIPKEFRPDGPPAQSNLFGLVPTVNPVTLPSEVGSQRFFRSQGQAEWEDYG